MSVGYVALGLSYVFGPATRSRQLGFEWLPASFDADELGWLWLIAALLGFIGGFFGVRYPRWESFAFGGLLIPPSVWAFCFLVAWVMGEHPFGWISTISYGLFTLISFHAAAWPDPVDGGGGVCRRLK